MTDSFEKGMVEKTNSVASSAEVLGSIVNFMASSNLTKKDQFWASWLLPWVFLSQNLKI